MTRDTGLLNNSEQLTTTLSKSATFSPMDVRYVTIGRQCGSSASFLLNLLNCASLSVSYS